MVSVRPSVRHSVRMKQHDSHLSNFSLEFHTWKFIFLYLLHILYMNTYIYATRAERGFLRYKMRHACGH
jgi:hypothetical protein